MFGFDKLLGRRTAISLACREPALEPKLGESGARGNARAQPHEHSDATQCERKPALPGARLLLADVALMHAVRMT